MRDGWKASMTAEERIQRRAADLAAAQVHATLALAAATSLRPASRSVNDPDTRAWLDTANTKGATS